MSYFFTVIKQSYLKQIIWEGILTVLFLTIFYLLYKRNRNKRVFEKYEKTILEDAKTTQIDMSDMMDNVFKSQHLYDSLKKKVHPDRFSPNQEKIKIANELATMINNHKADYKKLQELKNIAELKLDIKL